MFKKKDQTFHCTNYYEKVESSNVLQEFYKVDIQRATSSNTRK
jgi:hypothetical protein